MTVINSVTSTQGALYERFGFGLATWTRPITLHAATATFREATPTGRLRTLEAGALASVAAPVHDRARRRHPGAMDRAAGSRSSASCPAARKRP